MSANVETMVSVRQKPWHGLGTIVQEAPNSKEALELAGLDWEVKQGVIFGEDGQVIKGFRENYRMAERDCLTKHTLGIVSDRYQIVQNVDAFEFTDNLIGGDVRYETAGSLREGRTVWMLAKLPEAKVAGDDVEQYMCFSNTHDGTGAVKVCLTPIRVVCNNTLNFALQTAKRCWSMKHTGDMQRKIIEARECLELADRYILQLDEYAETMTKIKIDDVALKLALEKCFPIRDDMTIRERTTAEKQRDEFMICYFMPDIEKFRGTAWGAINAMTDFVGHSDPARHTKKFEENRWGKIMNGHVLVDQMAALVRKEA